MEEVLINRNWRDYTDDELSVFFYNTFIRHGYCTGDSTSLITPTDFAELLRNSGFDIGPHLVLEMVMRADKSHNGRLVSINLLPAVLGVLNEQARSDTQGPNGSQPVTGTWPGLEAITNDVELLTCIEKLWPPPGSEPKSTLPPGSPLHSPAKVAAAAAANAALQRQLRLAPASEDLWTALESVTAAANFRDDPSFEDGGYWFPGPTETLLTLKETYALEEVIGAYTGIKAVQRSSLISREVKASAPGKQHPKRL